MILGRSNFKCDGLEKYIVHTPGENSRTFTTPQVDPIIVGMVGVAINQVVVNISRPQDGVIQDKYFLSVLAS